MNKVTEQRILTSKQRTISARQDLWRIIIMPSINQDSTHKGPAVTKNLVECTKMIKNRNSNKKKLQPTTILNVYCSFTGVRAKGEFLSSLWRWRSLVESCFGWARTVSSRGHVIILIKRWLVWSGWWPVALLGLWSVANFQRFAELFIQWGLNIRKFIERWLLWPGWWWSVALWWPGSVARFSGLSIFLIQWMLEALVSFWPIKGHRRCYEKSAFCK